MNKIAIIFDETNDWLFYYFKKYNFKKNNDHIDYFYDAYLVKKYDVVFILGYTKILSKEFLYQNKLNLVVHESNLPHGKGFSPLQNQLINNKNEIVISLLEANEIVDSGDIILQTKIYFDGTELYKKIRRKQADATIDIIEKFLKSYPNFIRRQQVGKSSYYPKRNPSDQELDINKSIIENFNLLRIGNNDLWPSFFKYKGKKYIIKISESGE